MNSILLIDDSSALAPSLGVSLIQRGHCITRVHCIKDAMDRLRRRAQPWDIVILIMGDHSRPWFTLLHNLQEAAWNGAIREGLPLFLCVSKHDFGVDFELRMERMGARYVCDE